MSSSLIVKTSNVEESASPKPTTQTHMSKPPTGFDPVAWKALTEDAKRIVKDQIALNFVPSPTSTPRDESEKRHK